MTMKEVKAVNSKSIETYITNLEQAEYWVKLLTEPAAINKKDGSGTFLRKRTFESARKAYFEKFYNVEEESEEREIEREAYSILDKFKEKKG